MQLLSNATGAVVIVALLLTGAGFALGVSMTNPEQLLDARAWMQAATDCLRSL